MAVLQAWPGRGFWSGNSPLAGMTGEMSGTPQPRPLASLVGSFGQIVAAYGSAVNLVAVIVLAAAGLGLLSARPRLVGPRCWPWSRCARWTALVQDTGVFVGLGTDPNSMIPVALLIIAACLAWTANCAAPVPAVRRPRRYAAPGRYTAPGRHAAPGYAIVPSGTPSPPTRFSRITEASPRVPPSQLKQLAAGPAQTRRRTWRRHWRAPRRWTAGWRHAAGPSGSRRCGGVPFAAAAADRSADPLIARALNAGDPGELPGRRSS